MHQHCWVPQVQWGAAVSAVGVERVRFVAVVNGLKRKEDACVEPEVEVVAPAQHSLASPAFVPAWIIAFVLSCVSVTILPLLYPDLDRCVRMS